MSADTPPAPLSVVIDTQTALDWLLFRSPYTQAWPRPGRHWRWIATAAMRQELSWVLARPWPEGVVPRRAVTLALFDRLATLRLTPKLTTPAPRCKDASDQIFVDLALAHAPSLLLSRDRAVLALAKRMAKMQVTVTRGDCHGLFMATT